MGRGNSGNNTFVRQRGGGGGSDGGKGKAKGKKYSPKVTIPTGQKARESEERKTLLRNKIEIKRLTTIVNKLKGKLTGEDVIEEEEKIDPNFQLKGAARPALEVYAPKSEPKQRKNLLAENRGKLWEVPDGKEYLTAMSEYATALNNLMNKSREAVALFEEMLELDLEDHMRAKEQLLRCHLDNGDAVNARLLLEKYTDDKCNFFMYSRAFLEFISFDLKEKGSSAEIRDNALKEAIAINPYIIWLLAYEQIFSEVIEEAEELLEDDVQNALNKPGSIVEAYTFFKNDGQIWLETDKTIEWLLSFIEENELTPPEVEVQFPDVTPTEESTTEEQAEFLQMMYLDMFQTGCEAIEEQLLGGGN